MSERVDPFLLGAFRSAMTQRLVRSAVGYDLTGVIDHLELSVTHSLTLYTKAYFFFFGVCKYTRTFFRDLLIDWCML